MSEPDAIAAVVLAAGTAQRFGGNKLLYPLARHGLTLPLAAHSLLPWLATFAAVSVVIRPGFVPLRRVIETALGPGQSAHIRWVECPDAAQGMSASLAAGVHANRNAAGWLIGLADMPAVPAAAIRGVRSALAGGATLAAPYCLGRRGHPVGFAACYGDELLDLQGDAGARRVLEGAEADVAQVAIDHAGIFADVDLPADLGKLPGGAPEPDR